MYDFDSIRINFYLNLLFLFILVEIYCFGLIYMDSICIRFGTGTKGFKKSDCSLYSFKKFRVGKNDDFFISGWLLMT